MCPGANEEPVPKLPKFDTSVKDKKRLSSELVPTAGHDTELRRVQQMKAKWARINDEQGGSAAS